MGNLIDMVKLLPMATITKLLDQFRRMVEIEARGLETDTGGRYTPTLVAGQVVKVNFIGLGSVMNLPHFAVVWRALPYEPNLVVIPLTSKFKPGQEFYNLGQIDGLPERDSIVVANQPQTVSRKSVRVCRKGANRESLVNLSEVQMMRLNDMVRRALARGELPLRNVLEKNIKIMVPLLTKSHFDDLDRPVTYAIEGDILSYQIYDKVKINVVELVRLSITSKTRKELLRQLLSGNLDQINEAQTIIQMKLTEVQAAAGSNLQ